jgi:AAA+ superfamily predicted ATPase
LPLIAKDDEFNIVDKVCATLEDGKGYSRVELAQMYADLHVAHQKTVEFPEYAEFAAVEKRAEKKVEGVAYPTLQNMIGLTSVKEQIDNIISFAKVQKLALSMGLKSPAVTKHMVFTGSPGTAKTTVARLFAQIMKDNDLLTSGVFIEAGRADLIAEYVGHTAPKVRDCFKRARGGVLFIDEAYSLVDDRKGLFGDEAIATIVQEMENNRDSIIVIFAGYREETLGFVNRNSGLKSRIAHYVDFPDYNEGELVAILTHMAKEQGLTIDGGTDALLGIMKTAVGKSNFGNGRFSRNLLDKARLKQAGRVAKMDNPQAEDICTLQAADFELPQEYCNQKAKVMGFGE